MPNTPRPHSSVPAVPAHRTGGKSLASDFVATLALYGDVVLTALVGVARLIGAVVVALVAQ